MLNRLTDIAAISVGIISFIFIFFVPQDSKAVSVATDAVCITAGIIGMAYVIYAVYLFFFRKIEMDRKLADGNFLRKVICLVLLLPFTLTILAAPFISGPKELAYDDAIYGEDDMGVDEGIRSRQESPTLFWTMYFHFVDPGNQHMSTTLAGRGIAGITAFLGIFLLNGLLVSSIISFIDRRKEWRLDGETRYSVRDLGKNRFAVVIGANEIASSIIKNLLSARGDGDINFKCEGNNRYIILQTSQDAQAVRNELESHLSDEELRKIIIYKALRDSKPELEKLCLKYATEIYVLGESTSSGGGEPHHDAMNMKCVNLMAEILEGCPKRKVCKVLFEYQTTYSILQFSGITENVDNSLVFIPFNRYESWARKVIVECRADGSGGKTIEYTPLDGHGISTASDEHVHFVIVGMSRMGVAMGIEALHQAHYLNSDRQRTRLTFIDTNADKELDFFKGRYDNLFQLVRHRFIDANSCLPEQLDSDFGWIDPMTRPECRWRHLSDDGSNFMDTELEFVKGEVESDGVREYLRRISSSEKSKLTVAICLPQTHQAVAASLYMPLEIYEKAQQIWVWQNESDDIISNLNGTPQKDRRYKKLRPFGMEYGEYICDRTLYLKALLVNEAYAMNKNPKIDIAKKDTFDDLRRSWRALPIDKKFSNKYYADSIYLKLRGIICNQDRFIIGPEDIVAIFGREGLEKRLSKILNADKIALAVCEHNRWNMQQLLFGYLPCDAARTEIFRTLNRNVSEAKASGDKQRTDEAKSAFRKTKDEYKESEQRIHPNICAYGHLDIVDAGAKQYDIDINDSIPRILELVDMKTIQ